MAPISPRMSLRTVRVRKHAFPRQSSGPAPACRYAPDPARVPKTVDYTIKNLRQVEDVAPKFGFSEVQEARFPREQLAAETIGLAYHIVRPGKRQAFAHRHEQAEEIYVVLSGRGRIKLDGDIAAVSPLDAIRIAPHVARAFEAGPEGLELLVFGPRHAGDGDVLREDFWSEA
jgi:mannose-6-phosphate isomerase-like protein (cupin superfamily)